MRSISAADHQKIDPRCRTQVLLKHPTKPGFAHAEIAESCGTGTCDRCLFRSRKCLLVRFRIQQALVRNRAHRRIRTRIR